MNPVTMVFGLRDSWKLKILSYIYLSCCFCFTWNLDKLLFFVKTAGLVAIQNLTDFSCSMPCRKIRLLCSKIKLLCSSLLALQQDQTALWQLACFAARSNCFAAAYLLCSKVRQPCSSLLWSKNKQPCSSLLCSKINLLCSRLHASHSVQKSATCMAKRQLKGNIINQIKIVIKLQALWPSSQCSPALFAHKMRCFFEPACGCSWNDMIWMSFCIVKNRCDDTTTQWSTRSHYSKSISVYCLVSNSVLVLQEWKLDPRTPAMSRFFSLQHGHEILQLDNAVGNGLRAKPRSSS